MVKTGYDLMLKIFQKIGILNKEILIVTLEDYEILQVKKVALQSWKHYYV